MISLLLLVTTIAVVLAAAPVPAQRPLVVPLRSGHPVRPSSSVRGCAVPAAVVEGAPGPSRADVPRRP